MVALGDDGTVIGYGDLEPNGHIDQLYHSAVVGTGIGYVIYAAWQERPMRARVLLTTFHSFAGGLLRQHDHLVGIEPDFTILTQVSDRIGVLDDAPGSIAGSADVTLPTSKAAICSRPMRCGPMPIVTRSAC